MKNRGLLVASPQMSDVFFAKTVVLLCDYNEEGALGLIVNRVTNLGSREVLSQMEVTRLGGIEGPVHWGGPVQPGAVFLTYARQPESLRGIATEDLEWPVFELSPDLWVSPAKEVIEAVASEQDNPGAFLSLGYAGWGAGQLDAEIQSGSWIFLEQLEGIIFKIEPEDLYQHCLDSLGVETAQLWMHPVEE